MVKLNSIRQDIVMSKAFDFDSEFVFRMRHKKSVLKKGQLKKWLEHMSNVNDLRINWCLATPFNLHPIGHNDDTQLKFVKFKLREELVAKNKNLYSTDLPAIINKMKFKKFKLV